MLHRHEGSGWEGAAGAGGGASEGDVRARGKGRDVGEKGYGGHGRVR